ncbi:hypothetical protein Cgig2_011608 [Carnegiea gigantea]|uniref:Uncharacterized protein n=1 Tax=Carnegiea gigantea TaxID=171969 RepID=A0A9Q1GHP4_9CARY|nr:hypothetical protein Cgig2_011608 [Carnegiea gigantea]
MSSAHLIVGSIVPSLHKALFNHLATSLNRNLVASELKQRKFASAIALCSLVLEFEPNNAFRRAKVAVDLHNSHKALCDLREVARIEPNNSEIAKELAKAESAECQFEACSKDSEDLEHGVGSVVKWPHVKSPTECEGSRIVKCEQLVQSMR